MATNHSIDFYVGIGYLYPYLTYGIVSVMAIFIVPMLIYCESIRQVSKISNSLRTFMYSVSKIVFNEMKERKVGNKVQCYIFEAELNDRAFVATYSVGVLSLTGSLLIAWSVLIMKESNKCDDGYDCFDSNGTYIEDCTEYKDETVSCFKLTFQYNLAIAAAGGVLALSSKALAFMGHFLVPIFRHRLIRYNTTKRKFEIGYVHQCIISFLPLVIAGGMIGILIYVGHLQSTTTRDIII